MGRREEMPHLVPPACKTACCGLCFPGDDSNDRVYYTWQSLHSPFQPLPQTRRTACYIRQACPRIPDKSPSEGQGGANAQGICAPLLRSCFSAKQNYYTSVSLGCRTKGMLHADDVKKGGSRPSVWNERRTAHGRSPCRGGSALPTHADQTWYRQKRKTKWHT